MKRRSARVVGMLIASVSLSIASVGEAQQLRCGPAGGGRPAADGQHCECVTPRFVEQVVNGQRRCVPRPAQAHHESHAQQREPAINEAPPTPPPAAREPACPEGMVLIPAGVFWMGSADGEGEADERPQCRARLSAYCIDRTEVTVRAYRACVSTGACAPQRTIKWLGMTEADQNLYNPTCNLGRDGVDDHPVNCIDWANADAFCRSRGARLPTEAEWEHAARCDDNRTWPWGNAAPDETRLNACGAECVRWGREHGQTWSPMYPGDDGWATTAPVGNYPRGASPFGVFDMAGNVWEWTADWYVAGYNDTGNPVFNPTGPVNGTLRVDRGGGWNDNDPSRVRAADRNWIGSANRSLFLGFRCARGVM